MEKKYPIFVVDRSKPLNLTEFFGAGWKVVEEDRRALGISIVDFSRVRFRTGLKDGETHVFGEEKLRRLAELPEIRLDAQTGVSLYAEEGQKTLRRLYDENGITSFELVGSVLSQYGRRRFFLFLYRRQDGSWGIDCVSLEYARLGDKVSPLLAS